MGDLPDFVPPMLARPGRPFDSDRHVFEVKWDGIRAQCFVDGDGVRALTRRKNRCEERYPELDALAALPPGMALDGELVALDSEGRPDFERVLRREQARGTQNVRVRSAEVPAHYVVFDVLYDGFQSRMDAPFGERRERVAEICAELGDARVIASDGVVGEGTRFFESVCERGLEGVVAKRLDSRYLPGRRTEAWQKIKRTQSLHCVVLGYLPKEDDVDDFQSLIVAAPDEQGSLRAVGRVASGITESTRASLRELMRERMRAEPLVQNEHDGRWIEPGLFVRVAFHAWTSGGNLRAPYLLDFEVQA